MIAKILNAYGISTVREVMPLTSGLINTTWKVDNGAEQFIVQRINVNVFKKPFEVAQNIRMLDDYLKKNHPGYLFVSPLQNLHGDDIYYDQALGYYRIFPFIKKSHTINVVKDPAQSFEAALQFGKFTSLLAGFDALKLNITIPDFHNLTLRYQQFETALKVGNSSRIKQSNHLVQAIIKYDSILNDYEKIQKNSSVKHRVTHHDTKISNVLFDDKDRGLCVIDLDTVMPGYFISDMGDMMRTYLSPANEEEKDFDKIEVRDIFFKAIVQGYLSSMGGVLTQEEKNLILYSGLFIIYMQAIRFLADYFNDDVYYGARYEDQNFVRAGNQLSLLKKLVDKKKTFEGIIADELKIKNYFIL